MTIYPQFTLLQVLSRIVPSRLLPSKKITKEHYYYCTASTMRKVRLFNLRYIPLIPRSQQKAIRLFVPSRLSSPSCLWPSPPRPPRPRTTRISRPPRAEAWTSPAWPGAPIPIPTALTTTAHAASGRRSARSTATTTTAASGRRYAGAIVVARERQLGTIYIHTH